MTTPDLDPTLREALIRALDADRAHDFLSGEERAAFLTLRDACPDRLALEDGIYEVPDRYGSLLRYVRDGRYSRSRNTDGTLYDSLPLPADVSTWRRIDGPPTITPEQLEETARKVSGYPESEWADLAEASKGYWRDGARRILAAAGIEVRDV